MTTLEHILDKYDTSQVWAWSEPYDDLFDLVRVGQKRAISSYYPKFEAMGRDLPAEGAFHILVDRLSSPQKALVLQWTEVRLYSYTDVAEDVLDAENMSYLEWFDRYQTFFEKEAEAIGRVFELDEMVVTQFFRLVEEVVLEED